MEKLISAREARIAAHNELRKSPEWQSISRRLEAITIGFFVGLHSCWRMSTRWPSYYDNTLTFRFMDDLLESAITIRVAVANGALNPARRDLRFVLEPAINHSYVDRILPKADLATKLAHPDAKNVDTVKVAKALGLHVGPLYGKLSQIVHPTPAQLQRRLTQSAQGIYIGFETPAELDDFAQMQLEVYDIALWCIFDALGPGLTGDVFINMLDDLLWWPFHHTPLIYALSVGFNYKAERKNRQAGPARDRLQDFVSVLKARRQILLQK